MPRRATMAAIAVGLALGGCGDKKPVFIEYTGAYPSADKTVGATSDVWKASALAYVEGIYQIYRRGGHASLMDMASGELVDALKYGRAPPVDPLCDCTILDRVTINAEALEVKPPLSAKLVVAVNNMGRPNNIYLYLTQTPLGYRIGDVATPSMRQGLLFYLRSNKKTDEELEAERVAAIERGECPPLDNGC